MSVLNLSDSYDEWRLNSETCMCLFCFQSRYNQQLIANRELQQKINFQAVEIETFKRQIDSVQSVMSFLFKRHHHYVSYQTILGKDNEIAEVREKMKTEHEKKLRSIQKDIDMNDEFKDRIKQLENDLKGIYLSTFTLLSANFLIRSTIY